MAICRHYACHAFNNMRKFNQRDYSQKHECGHYSFESFTLYTVAILATYLAINEGNYNITSVKSN